MELTESLNKNVDVGTLLNNLDRIEKTADAIIAKLPVLDDDQLIQAAICARQLEGQAFRIRGACASEARQRIAVRLSGGRGKKDVEGVGIKAVLARMASECGIDLRTLEEDAKIHEQFFASKQPETDEVNTTVLGREFFRLALNAPNPAAAIAVAEEKLTHDAGFNTRQFGRLVKELKKHSVTDVGKAQEIAGQLYWLNVPISQEAREALAELVKRHSGEHFEMMPGEVASIALIHLRDCGNEL